MKTQSVRATSYFRIDIVCLPFVFDIWSLAAILRPCFARIQKNRRRDAGATKTFTQARQVRHDQVEKLQGGRAGLLDGYGFGGPDVHAGTFLDAVILGIERDRGLALHQSRRD